MKAILLVLAVCGCAAAPRGLALAGATPSPPRGVLVGPMRRPMRRPMPALGAWRWVGHDAAAARDWTR